MSARIDAQAIEEMEVQGAVVRPGEPGYDEARRVYNVLHDRKPAAVVRPSGPDDVAEVIRFASRHRVPLAVRGGGHGMPGFASTDGGVVLDLGGLRDVVVDPERRVARVGGGALWRDVNEATHRHGLATTGGLISTTGVGGLTLGGGIGYLSRARGLACDNLVGAEVVVASGKRVHCGLDQNRDLFWALRGGGGNFGVVTAFEFRLHPLETVVAGPTFFPLDAEVVLGFRDWIREAPEGLGAILGLTLAPPLPVLSESLWGKPVAVVVSCWAGDHDTWRPLEEAMERWAPVLGRNVGPMPYPVVNTLFDDLLPWGLRHYWTSHFVQDVPRAAARVHAERGREAPTIQSGTFFYPMDGAAARVPADATAFPHRGALFAVGIHGSWRDARNDERCLGWVRDTAAALAPWAGEGEYVNFRSDAAGRDVRRSYGPNWTRLVEVKRRWDPDNLFRLNQNVPPRAGREAEEAPRS